MQRFSVARRATTRAPTVRDRPTNERAQTQRLDRFDTEDDGEHTVILVSTRPPSVDW